MSESGLDKEPSVETKIADIIKGYEPVAHLDGNPGKKEIPNGYDLAKDSRTEFGFYWEYEDMDDCAKKIAALFSTQQAQMREELQEYTDFLENYGYVDSDVWSEKPTALERFLGGER